MPGAVVIGRALAIAVMLAPMLAAADPAADRAALTRFEAVYRTTARRSGAARTDQACADADKLGAASAAFSHATAPAGAPVDDLAWSDASGALIGRLEQLGKVCKQPGRKLNLHGTLETADEIVAQVDEDVTRMLRAARPRVLGPALTRAQAAIAAMVASSQAMCGELPKLSHALAGAARPSAGVPAAAWNGPYQTVVKLAGELRPAACGGPPLADREISSAFVELHDAFYQLVLLVPPR